MNRVVWYVLAGPVAVVIAILSTIGGLLFLVAGALAGWMQFIKPHDERERKTNG
jgi:hypothetical protein